MIKTKAMGSLIVISAPSGAGKGSICEAIQKQNNNIWLSISCTSRNPRDGEIDGKNYYFLTKDQFEEKIKSNEFLEYAEYNDNYYGTPKDKINEKLKEGKDVVLEIEVQGALKVKELIKEAIFIFILPPSMDELKKRLESRGTETEEKILARFKTAYNEINELPKYNYVVINDTLDRATSKVLSIIEAEKCRVERIEEVYLNNPEEKIHEKIMDKEFINNEMVI